MSRFRFWENTSDLAEPTLVQTVITHIGIALCGVVVGILKVVEAYEWLKDVGEDIHALITLRTLRRPSSHHLGILMYTPNGIKWMHPPSAESKRRIAHRLEALVNKQKIRTIAFYAIPFFGGLAWTWVVTKLERWKTRRR